MINNKPIKSNKSRLIKTVDKDYGIMKFYFEETLTPEIFTKKIYNLWSIN